MKTCFALIVPIEVNSILINGYEEGLALVNWSAEEAVEGSEATIEDLDLLDSGSGISSPIWQIFGHWLASILF